MTKHILPTTVYASIEFPGPVLSTSRALNTIGGLPHISRILSNPTTSLQSTPSIELNLSPSNTFTHTIPAVISQTSNIVLKVVKRRRKRPKLDQDGLVMEEGVFEVQVAGVVKQSVRFRGMLVLGSLVASLERRELIVLCLRRVFLSNLQASLISK